MKLSSESSNQRQRILRYLQNNNRMTTLQARTELDILHPAARVQELKAQGHNIITYRRQASTDKGDHKAVAEYVLLGTITEEE